MNKEKLSSPFVIAEVGQNHDGSFGLAHSFVDAVARTGADAIKFQTHIAEAESTPGEPFRIPFSYEDASRYDYWKRMEFTPDQWLELKSHCDEVGLKFMSSPFSMAAVELLEKIDVHAWKVGSGEIGSLTMLERMASSGRRIFVSTGMSSYDEIDLVVNSLRKINADFVLMQCTSSYPVEPEEIGLNVLGEFRERFGCPVGLSDHSGTIFPSLAATALGADAIEVHVTLSRDMFGPDIASSLTIDELATLVEGVCINTRMLSSCVDKDAIAERMANMRDLFTKSAVASRSLSAGHILGPADVTFKKPGNGISEQAYRTLKHKPLAQDIESGAFLRVEDFEE